MLSEQSGAHDIRTPLEIEISSPTGGTPAHEVKECDSNLTYTPPYAACLPHRSHASILIPNDLGPRDALLDLAVDDLAEVDVARVAQVVCLLRCTARRARDDACSGKSGVSPLHSFGFCGTQAAPGKDRKSVV